MMSMKPAALLITTLLFVFAVKEAEGSIRNYVRTSAEGDGASVNVDIKNNVNTGSSTTRVQDESTTKVEIDQEGGGTSSVTINGKEYKVEGTGSLNIEEKTPLGSPTVSPTVTGNPTATPSESEENNEVVSIKDENKSFLANLFAGLRERFKSLLSSFF